MIRRVYQYIQEFGHPEMKQICRLLNIIYYLWAKIEPKRSYIRYMHVQILEFVYMYIEWIPWVQIRIRSILMKFLETLDCTDESRKYETCLQLMMKKHYIKTWKTTLEHIYTYEILRRPSKNRRCLVKKRWTELSFFRPLRQNCLYWNCSCLGIKHTSYQLMYLPT